MATTFMESGSDATQGTEFFNAIFGTGTVASDTAQARTGPRSIKITTHATTGVGNELLLSNVLFDTGFRSCWAIRFTDLPTTNGARLWKGEQVSDGSAILQLVITTGGVLQLANGDTDAQYGSNGSTLTTGIWYHLCIVGTVTSTTVNEFRMFLNGVLDISLTNVTLPFNGFKDLIYSFKDYVGTMGNSKVAHLDDFYIDDSSALTYPGNIRITAKRPNANGTTVGFTTQIGVGGSGYGTGHSPQVNEQPLSTTNGWSMIGAGSAVTEEYNIENASTGDVGIPVGSVLVDYMGWVYAKSSGSQTASIVVNNSASNISLTTTNTMFTKVAGATTYPAGTGTDIGIITTTALQTVSLYECGIIFAYILGSIGSLRGSSFHPGRGMRAQARFRQTLQGHSRGVIFRKTLSPVGTRTGSRQTHNT